MRSFGRRIRSMKGRVNKELEKIPFHTITIALLACMSLYVAVNKIFN